LKRTNPRCADVAMLLLCAYPGLALDVCLGDESFGETTLHLAIINDDVDLVYALLELGADVHARATGRFFQPDDQQTAAGGGVNEHTDYVGYAYYGEYPLAFAACTGNKDIYDALLTYGADPNARDYYGNTVLHMCVVHENTVRGRH
jgi:ankyrin repeat protein